MSVPAAVLAATEPRPGYDLDAEATERRVHPLLVGERVAWLSTVRPDGRPHLVPTWFWWDGTALLLWSKPEAVKVRNLRADPRVMVALGDAGADFSVGLIEARAELVHVPVPGAFLRKYRWELAEGGLDGDTFIATYVQAVRVVPTRYVGWHGRAGRHGARDGAAPGRGTGPATARGTRGAIERLAAVLGGAAGRLRGSGPAGALRRSGRAGAHAGA